jgi:hypothetical protein
MIEPAERPFRIVATATPRSRVGNDRATHHRGSVG